MTQGQVYALAKIVLGQECIVNAVVWGWLIEMGVIGDTGPNRQLAFELLSGQEHK